DGTGGAGGSQFFPGPGTFFGGDGGTGAIIGQPNGQVGENSPAGAGGGGGGAGHIVVVGNLQFSGLQSPVILTP
ncbi:MAG: hypothetical protein JKY56_17845, partial [Kofleriaceae bacterium]|nr:hypothetical protein [Kofleriaceae bacterium]